MQIKPTIVTYLDTRHKKNLAGIQSNCGSLFWKEQKYYPIGYDLIQAEYDAIRSDAEFKNLPIKARRKLQDVKIKCDAQLVKANEVVDKIPFFNFTLFEKKFLIGQHSSDSVYLYYEKTIKLKEEGRVGTASCYNTSMNSLKKFSLKLQLRDITVEFLKDYENWLIKKDRSSTTVGIYLRCLRAILNQAIEEGDFSQELYPFSKRR
ncbi:MAG: phage integrase SAM-like domain-containing protein [Chitinophagaceae bacterium]|nr:phage integrase SAM-like domain-containing protein [Chitinophagaceae bacterium]